MKGFVAADGLGRFPIIDLRLALGCLIVVAQVTGPVTLPVTSWVTIEDLGGNQVVTGRWMLVEPRDVPDQEIVSVSLPVDLS